MAKVNIVRGLVVSQSRVNGFPLSLPSSEVLQSETITSSGSSQSTSGGASQIQGDQYWRITVSGGAVWVKIAANPTAAANSDRLLLDGCVFECLANGGEKVAVIDA